MKLGNSSKKIWKFIIRDKNYITILALLLCFLFLLAGCIVSILRYWQYEAFYYDFGIFDKAIWEVSRARPPIIDHLVVGGKWIFADHFNPSIFSLSPLYWITEKREILLLAQAAAVAASGVVLYFIGVRVLKNKFYSLSVLICYLFFTGLQNAVITDFHEITIAVLPFMLCFWFIINRKLKWFFVSLLILLGFKESNFLIGIGMGVSIFLIDRKLLKPALFTVVISLLWGYLSISHIIPYFAGGSYQYGSDIQYNPAYILGTFVDNNTKQQTILHTFQSFGFIPIVAYQFWVLIFQDFFGRFYSPQWATRWGLSLHYSAMIAAIMGIATVYGFVIIQKYLKKKFIIDIVAALLILNAFFLYRFVLHGPFALAYNQSFYGQSSNFKFLDTLISKVPKDASVMAQNNLAVRFTHQEMWVLQSDVSHFKPDYYIQKKPEYIVIDGRSGQNGNNFFLIKSMPDLLAKIKKDKKYKLIYETEDQFVYKRVK